MTDDQDIIRRKAHEKLRKNPRPRPYSDPTGGGPVYSTEIGNWRTVVNVASLHPVVAARLNLYPRPARHSWVGNGAHRRCSTCGAWWVAYRNGPVAKRPKCKPKGGDE